ncbi:unnamed protein product [Rotaria magnacalcarata]|uniref:Uncharacterized protein n=2 Tax=Rotaria magnacalcarata TaxID=392030 RepID=A0A816QKJ7_9BILA|nr:unnamed protein product [Rotaria magnacalcarata]
MISISFNGIDPLFMYTQLFKEALLEIEDDDEKSFKELVEYCRLQGDIDEKIIDRVKREYHSHNLIWWYTAPYFVYSMLNSGLQLIDADIILKMRFFYSIFTQIYRTLTSGTTIGQDQSYSLSSLLWTSRDRRISFMYAHSVAIDNDQQSVSIIFVITIDSSSYVTSSIPFVDVKSVDYYQDAEEEILFSTHIICRINQIIHIEDDATDKLWQVDIILVGNDDHDMNILTSHLRQELTWREGWSRFSDILIRVGDNSKAEHLYNILLDRAFTQQERRDNEKQIA